MLLVSMHCSIPWLFLIISTPINFNVMSLIRVYFKVIFLAMCLAHSTTLLAQDDNVYLIVRADDMGYSHSGNLAIEESIVAGITTSVEVIVPSPWYLEAIEILKKYPSVDIGVHLALTSEWDNIKWRPITSAESLVDERGYFFPMTWPNAHYPDSSILIKRNINPIDVEVEIQAQIDIIKQDVPITHLSTHMGWESMSAELYKVYEDVASANELSVLLKDYGVAPISIFGARVMDAQEKEETFIKILETLKPGRYILIAHPALDTPEQRAISHRGYERVAQDRSTDLFILKSEKVKKQIEALGIRLIDYKELKALGKK